MISIQEKIKSLRAKVNLTPAELAKNSELDPSYISKLESGELSSLSLKVSKALSKGFNLTLKDFMDEMGFFDDTTKPSYQLITSALRRNGYTPEQAKEIITYARYIKDKT